MIDNLSNKATDMASSVTSSDSYEAVPSVQEVAELKADLAEKSAEIDYLKREVRALKECDAEKSMQLDALTQKVQELEALRNESTENHRASLAVKQTETDDSSEQLRRMKKSDEKKAGKLATLTDQMQKMQAMLAELQKGSPSTFRFFEHGILISLLRYVQNVYLQRDTNLTIEHAGFGKVALRSRGKYLSSEDGRTPLMCNRSVVLDWERFDWIDHPDGTISLRGHNRKYVSSENGGAMTCNRRAAEAFTFGFL